MNLGAIGIPCKNIEESLEFYKILGLDFEKFSEGHYETKLKDGMRIMLDSYDLLKEINAKWKEPINPSITLCFEQKTIDGVDKIYEKIIEAGFEKEKEPWDAFWGQRYASVKDPSGNQIDLFAQL